MPAVTVCYPDTHTCVVTAEDAEVSEILHDILFGAASLMEAGDSPYKALRQAAHEAECCHAAQGRHPDWTDVMVQDYCRYVRERNPNIAAHRLGDVAMRQFRR